MTAIKSFAAHLIAGATAFALSFAMISATVANPTAPAALAAPELMA